MMFATALSVRPPHLPIVPLLQPLVPQRTQHDDWWEQHDHGGAAMIRQRHSLVASVDASDAWIVPLDWYWVRGPTWRRLPDRNLGAALQNDAAAASRSGRPVYTFFSGDQSCDRVGIRNSIVFREGPFRSMMGPYDRVKPAFVDDLVAAHLNGAIIERPWTDRPTIGFCGLAQRRRSLTDRFLSAAHAALSLATQGGRQPSQFLGENLRIDAIETLRSSKVVATSFIVRDSSPYFAGVNVETVRRQFVDNMVDCDYSLCIRGSGNYSYRLYEAICMGRIPIIVDTDIALPAEDRVPWRDIAVWVPQDRIDSIDVEVARFHANLDDEQFRRLQHRLRDIWVSELSARSFLQNIDVHAAAPSPGQEKR